MASLVRADGFVNLTAMCHGISKRPKAYLKTAIGQHFANHLKTKYGEDNVVTKGKGRYYACPELAVAIAFWANPVLAMDLMEHLKDVPNFMPKCRIRDKVAKEHSHAHTDVEALHISKDTVDVVTPAAVYAIEPWRQWRRGLGKVLAHGETFKEAQRVLVVFDTADDIIGAARFDSLSKLCARFGIAVQLRRA